MYGEARSTGDREWGLFLAMSALLVILCLWRLFVPAHEYPSRAEQVLTMLFDAALILGVMRLRGQAVAGDESRRGLSAAILAAALLAGATLFIIRFSGDDGWWTGHRIYHLRPR